MRVSELNTASMKNPDRENAVGVVVCAVRYAMFANFSVPPTLVNFQSDQSPVPIAVS